MASQARPTAAVRVSTPSFSKTCSRCFCTNEFGCTLLDNVDAGAVTIAFGSRFFMFGRSQFRFQGGDTAVAQPRFQYPGSLFGSSLTTWDFGRGPNKDLAVGVAGDGLANTGESPILAGLCQTLPLNAFGSVEVLYGQSGGFDLASPANQKFHQTTDFPTLGSSLQGFAEVGDDFGRTLY